MTTNATVVLFDSEGVEMSEPVPVEYVDGDTGEIQIDHVLDAAREAHATWIEFRAPDRKPLRAPIWQDSSRYVEPGAMKLGDTMTFSPMTLTLTID